MIQFRGVSVRKGDFNLSDVSLTFSEGSYNVVIGPAGSGKTTLLEAIAGITPLRSGEVAIAGRGMKGVSPENRDVGIVYQHGYLFPHLSVRENVAYGARDDSTVEEVSERFGVTQLFDRDIRGLSGGERQVVALARTIVRRPRVLLLDEPFSALDPRRRSLVRREVRSLHTEWGLTTVQVTHDFAEAGMLGDLAVLLDRGRVLQHGVPAEVFRKPVSSYVAEFLGAENVFAGVAREISGGVEGVSAGLSAGNELSYRAFAFETGDLTFSAVGDYAAGASCAVIRAEEVTIARDQIHDSVRNRFAGRVVEIQPMGALTRVSVEVRGVVIVAAVTSVSVAELGLAVGVAVVVGFKAMAVHLC